MALLAGMMRNKSTNYKSKKSPTAANNENRYPLMNAKPRVENAVVSLELLHEAIVGVDDGSAFPNIGQRHVQRPVLLLHGVGNDGGPRARNAHLTVHQHRLSALPVMHRVQQKFTQLV